MLTAMERDQFNEKRSNRLRDFILDDQELLVELIGSADIEVIKDLTRALQLSPCFDDMDKRSLLARIVKSYPAIQSLISGEQTKQEADLLVSWESLERRKNEYHELVEKKIPANSKEIAIARSYGDLRENHEYKAAKEMQKLLMRRKAELETQLVRARGTDFANARTDVVEHRHRRRRPPTWRRTSRSASPFSAPGIPTRRRASSATFRPSPSRCSTTRSATRWSSRSTASATTIASNPFVALQDGVAPARPGAHGLAAEGDVVIHVEQVEPGGDILALGRDLLMLPVEVLARLGVGRRPLVLQADQARISGSVRLCFALF